jgi:sodium transport system ATP-binding protein
MIQLENVTKSFDLNKKQRKENNTEDTQAIAVDRVSFTCQPGRVFGLLGPNGAGKTTTLRMLATILKPTSGKIEVCGVDLSTHPEQARTKMGFLTGSTGLYERLTANEIIHYFGELNQMEKGEVEERKNKLFDLLDMRQFQNKRIGQLSTGMKQKVSICRTMIHDPEVVIFDEPTSGLDVITAENIIRLINDCKNEGKTVIFSSHIMSEVDLLCDDLAIIHQGKLQFNDTMDNFRKNMQADNLTAEFIRIVEEAKKTTI